LLCLAPQLVIIINVIIIINVYCIRVAPDSIQQLHYEMANNLLNAMELKLRKTYIEQKLPKNKDGTQTQDE